MYRLENRQRNMKTSEVTTLILRKSYFKAKVHLDEEGCPIEGVTTHFLLGLKVQNEASLAGRF